MSDVFFVIGVKVLKGECKQSDIGVILHNLVLSGNIIDPEKGVRVGEMEFVLDSVTEMPKAIVDLAMRKQG